MFIIGELFVYRYTNEAPEMQMRRLADLSFMFQLYEMAYQTYHTLKRDFRNDNAWLHHAGTLVTTLYIVNRQFNLAVICHHFICVWLVA